MPDRLIDTILSVLPVDIELHASLILIALSAATSFMTAAAGIGGGIVLLAIMASLVPAPAIIPVHGMVQIGSNAGRLAIMFKHVEWRVLAPFMAGAVLGAGLGGVSAVQLPPYLLKVGLGCFILWTVWRPKPSAVGRFAVIITGAFSSFLTMLFGATGTFVSAMVKTLNLGRMEHVATQAACMVGQHAIKVLVFGMLGFNFSPYLGLIAAMVISGFVDTLVGKRFLLRMKDASFHWVLSLILTLLALRLLFEGLMGLAG
jgi:uncharacterized membrane protein YfcA